jgi:hypothetical protein
VHLHARLNAEERRQYQPSPRSTLRDIHPVYTTLLDPPPPICEYIAEIKIVNITFAPKSAYFCTKFSAFFAHFQREKGLPVGSPSGFPFLFPTTAEDSKLPSDW